MRGERCRERVFLRLASAVLSDAVLASRTPNTPTRGKGKGIGKARWATGRGAPLVPPTVSHVVDSEGRTSFGNDNIGLGLEQVGPGGLLQCNSIQVSGYTLVGPFAAFWFVPGIYLDIAQVSIIHARG